MYRLPYITVKFRNLRSTAISQQIDTPTKGVPKHAGEVNDYGCFQTSTAFLETEFIYFLSCPQGRQAECFSAERFWIYARRAPTMDHISNVYIQYIYIYNFYVKD